MSLGDHAAILENLRARLKGLGGSLEAGDFSVYCNAPPGYAWVANGQVFIGIHYGETSLASAYAQEEPQLAKGLRSVTDEQEARLIGCAQSQLWLAPPNAPPFLDWITQDGPLDFRVEQRVPSKEELAPFVDVMFKSSGPNVAMFFRDFQRSLCVALAISGVRLVGVARMSGSGESLFSIDDVQVLPDCRAQGIGSALVSELLRYARKNGGNGASVQVVPRHSTGSFFRKLGFEGKESAGSPLAVCLRDKG